MAALPSPFRLTDRLVDPALNRVTMPTGETVQVEPKIMLVLTVLAEHPSEVVTREDLMSRVWNGVFVTDDVLHRAIRELRRIFDDDSEAPRVIETIRKRGYRLIGPIETVGEVAGTGAARRAGGARRTTPVLAAIACAAVIVVTLIWLGRRPGTIDTEARVRFMPLTSEPGNEVDPALSSSGRLAYVARGDDGRSHLFTKVSADATAAQITRGDGTDRAPTWSPDESRVAFVRMDAAGCAIWIAAADGREPRMLVPCTTTDEFHMSWSPDGEQLAVTAGASTIRSPSHIEVLSVASGARRPVTEAPPAHSGDWSPAFSPDGREIAFVRSISGSISDIFIAPTVGGAPRRVTTDNADVLGVDWEPDGRHLVFSSDRAGGISVWRVSAEGNGEPVLLAGGGAKLKHPTVSRRTGIVAYEDWQYEINLREQATVEKGADAPVAISPTSDRWNFHPQISPDGRRLVFQSTRSGQYELWLSDRDGERARPLTRSAIYKSPARWAPDSRRLVFAARSGGATEITVLNVEDGAVRTVARETAAVAPVWSADGSFIYFGSLRSGVWQIWKVDASGGRAARQVTDNGGYAAMESPDGHWLYVARLDRVGLWRRPVAGGPETLVSERVLAEQWPNWGTYDHGIYYVTWPDDGDPCLALLENGATAPRVLGRLAEYAWTGIALSRDAARVIYAHADRRASNIGGMRTDSGK